MGRNAVAAVPADRAVRDRRQDRHRQDVSRRAAAGAADDRRGGGLGCAAGPRPTCEPPMVAKIGIVKMLLGALLPALLMIGAVAVWGARRDPRPRASFKPFDSRHARQATRIAKW